jgi:hypothetical protein
MIKLVKIVCLIAAVGSLYASPLTINSVDSFGTNTSGTINKNCINAVSKKGCGDTTISPSIYIETSQPYQKALQAVIENTKTLSIYFPKVVQENCI